MVSFGYIETNFINDNANAVIRGHNKKVKIKLDPETHKFDPNGEIYYFKYDAEKEKHRLWLLEHPEEAEKEREKERRKRRKRRGRPKKRGPKKKRKYISKKPKVKHYITYLQACQLNFTN